MRFQCAENYVLGDAIAAITVVFALKKADCDEFHGNDENLFFSLICIYLEIRVSSKCNVPSILSIGFSSDRTRAVIRPN